MNDGDSPLVRAISRMVAANDKHRFVFYRKPPNQILGPGASDESILRLEASEGIVLPPSYREFLLMHDGWKYYSGDADILSIAQRSDPATRRRLAEVSSWIASTGAANSKKLVIIAGLDSTYIVYLDFATRRGDGEVDVVEFGLEEGELDRHETFLVFLEDQSRVLEEMIADELGAPGS
jgi:hypothetical protein